MKQYIFYSFQVDTVTWITSYCNINIMHWSFGDGIHTDGNELALLLFPCWPVGTIGVQKSSEEFRRVPKSTYSWQGTKKMRCVDVRNGTTSEYVWWMPCWTKLSHCLLVHLLLHKYTMKSLVIWILWIELQPWAIVHEVAFNLIWKSFIFSSSEWTHSWPIITSFRLI